MLSSKTPEWLPYAIYMNSVIGSVKISQDLYCQFLHSIDAKYVEIILLAFYTSLTYQNYLITVCWNKLLVLFCSVDKDN
jgi:hypothetical protein